jgi:catechol 2,3-dioxygenase-like lactoylglutathione lyase family enzyme
MSRIQLALNVPDLDQAVAFYAKLFGTAPAKRRTGYANFAIAEPPLKLVLFERPDAESRLNHLGVEVASSVEVSAARAHLADQGVASTDGSGVCCFASQDKVWVDGPDGSWEIYAVLGDSETETAEALCCGADSDGRSVCC